MEEFLSTAFGKLQKFLQFLFQIRIHCTGAYFNIHKLLPIHFRWFYDQTLRSLARLLRATGLLYPFDDFKVLASIVKMKVSSSVPFLGGWLINYWLFSNGISFAWDGYLLSSLGWVPGNSVDPEMYISPWRKGSFLCMQHCMHHMRSQLYFAFPLTLKKPLTFVRNEPVMTDSGHTH